MANNTDLVKEIEEAEGFVQEAINLIDSGDEITVGSRDCFEIIRATLQRARDALRWKPFPKQVPEGGNGDYLVQRAIPSGGAIRTKIQTSTYWANSARRQGAPGSWGCSGVVAFMELPPKYTPEEK